MHKDSDLFSFVFRLAAIIFKCWHIFVNILKCKCQSARDDGEIGVDADAFVRHSAGDGGFGFHGI